MYNGEDNQVEELKRLMKEFDMPCSLAEIGINTSPEINEKLFQRLCTYPFMTHDKEHEELLEKSNRICWRIKMIYKRNGKKYKRQMEESGKHLMRRDGRKRCMVRRMYLISA